MDSIPIMDGIQSRKIKSKRLTMHVLEHNEEGEHVLVLVHGNASSSTFFEELMLTLPSDIRSMAPDMRGYGYTEAKPIDATRGARDGSDDLIALLDAAEIRKPVHLLGWSLGAGWAMQTAIDAPERVRSLILVSPVSPYGFGGTRDIEGHLTFPDGACSGAGGVAPEFPERIKNADRGTESNLSPRNVMNAFYFKPPFKAKQEEAFLTSMLHMIVGDDNYPGDVSPSKNWPGSAPGKKGVLNAFSPLYFNATMLTKLEHKPPVLWVRGADDQVVSNASLWDVATLGALGAIPGYPGADRVPSQPMVDQTRAFFEGYARAGGRYQEVVFENCAHSPHIEHPERFLETLTTFLKAL